MKYIDTIKKQTASMVMAVAFIFVSTPLWAIVPLVAIEGQWTPAGGDPITMWGFAEDTGQACDSLPAWTVGPEITVDDLEGGGNLRIRLRNCLDEPTSIIIPGQKAIVPGTGATQSPQPVWNGNRITSFTITTAPNATEEYRWRRVRQTGGTALYMSGTHPAKQVHMGLYGALKVGTYDGTSGDVTLLYSEIDPALHNPPTPATPLEYKPKYFLVNGLEEVDLTAGDTSAPTVLSFFNAGLDFHVLALNKGYLDIVAEDGNPYPFSKNQYSVNLPAGKTIDAFWQPAADGTHVIYDRRGNNMLARLTVGAGAANTPIAAPDTYLAVEDTALDVESGIGLLFNDTVLPLNPEVELMSGPAAGALSCTDGGLLCADGSFSYQPNGDFTGSDSFTYRIKAGVDTPASNVATVTITVGGANDPPTATDDSFEAIIGVSLVVDAPGVLSNDSDPDGDGLTVTAGPVNADGSFAFSTPVTPGTETFGYTISDGNGGTASATVMISVVNDTPVAVDDVATVKRNSTPANAPERNIFSILANDSDANGLDLASVVLSGTSQGGTVVYNGNGTVSYTPVRRWRGTDTFTYTVEDNVGEISNTATVRVNVVRRRDLPQL